MLYRHTTQHCFEERIGADGISHARAEHFLQALTPAFLAVKAGENKGAKPIIEHASQSEDLASILEIAARIRQQFTHVVVAGAGGSGLSGRALMALLPGGSSPMVSFLETIDPDAIAAALNGRDIKKTGFIFISKSGETVETLSHFFAIRDHLKHAAGITPAGDHFTVITEPGNNPLRRAAMAENARILDHHPGIGGRFAILTNVGLLPAAIAGLNIRAIRDGAQQTVQQFRQAQSPTDTPPALGAAMHLAFMEKHRSISVMMPYGERFTGLVAWWRQSWAESLGKGGNGTTPVRAVGPTDQHSQLQLYLDGPKDKFFHMFTLPRAGTGQPMPMPDLPELDYLRGKTTGDVMAAEQKATIETMIKNRCPVRLFELERLDEASFGALIMHFTLEIIFTASLLGVNAFDQPAVEESKRLAREYLLNGNL